MPSIIHCRFWEVCRQENYEGDYTLDFVWICEQCKRQAKEALARRTEYGGKAIQCPSCYHIYCSWRKLCQHWEQTHAHGDKLTCPICKISFFRSRRGFDMFFRHIKKTRFMPHESGYEVLDALDGMGKKSTF